MQVCYGCAVGLFGEVDVLLVENIVEQFVVNRPCAAHFAHHISEGHAQDDGYEQSELPRKFHNYCRKRCFVVLDKKINRKTNYANIKNQSFSYKASVFLSFATTFSRKERGDSTSTFRLYCSTQ